MVTEDIYSLAYLSINRAIMLKGWRAQENKLEIISRLSLKNPKLLLDDK